MADVDLLPLPEHFAHQSERVQEHVRAYARANLPPLQAEVERLRAEMEDYRTNGAAAVRFAPNSAHWSNELRRLFGDDARAGIEVLENWHRKEYARAERLAEALRAIHRAAHDGCSAMDCAREAYAALAQGDRND